MWYFAWLLGLPLAALFAVLNAMWLELRTDACLAEEGSARWESISAEPASTRKASWIRPCRFRT